MKTKTNEEAGGSNIDDPRKPAGKVMGKSSNPRAFGSPVIRRRSDSDSSTPDDETNFMGVKE